MLARGLVVAALVALLDQLSKLAVLGFFAAYAPEYRLIEITPFFDLVLTYNHGMSFGLFDYGSGFNTALFSAVAAAIIAILLWWLRRVGHPLLAGAVGNVVDRLRLGGVVDFLYFHAGPWYWPAFNLADTAICLGVAAMLLEGLLLRRQAH